MVIIFQKENGNTFTLFIIFIVKSLQKEQNSTNILLWPQSAGINLQTPQSDSTPWTLTLVRPHWIFYSVFLIEWNGVRVKWVCEKWLKKNDFKSEITPVFQGFATRILQQSGLID